MDKNIFSGLEHLGFDNLKIDNIYASDDKKNKSTVETTKQNKVDEAELLYNKTITCPVCDTNYIVKAVKNSSYRTIKKDSDFFTYFSLINPYFYDVYVCNKCGYSAIKTDYDKIKDHQKELVKKSITPKWTGKNYGEVYDVNTAIERYKLSLLNYTIIGSEASKKAMNCLKLAWMYRITEDTVNEQLFLKNALVGFNDAYFNERPPIYGMNKFTIMYLIGELYRRIGNNEDALLWFSNVITSHGVDPKLKEKARDQKDLIKEMKHLQELEKEAAYDTEVIETESKKKGLFAKFFK